MAESDGIPQWLNRNSEHFRKVANEGADRDAKENISHDILQRLNYNPENIQEKLLVTFHFNLSDDVLSEPEFYNTVTFTGSITNSIVDVQALTPLQYFHQTWPKESCNLLFSLYRQLVNPSMTCDLPCGEHEARITSAIRNGRCAIYVFGPADAVAVVSEQIAWLAALIGEPTTLETESSDTEAESSDTEVSETEGMMMFTYPVVASFKEVCPLTSSDTKGAFECEIGVMIKHVIRGSDYEGWQLLFEDQLIVTGYPIKQREKFCSGVGALEIPFDTMAELSQVNVYPENINHEGNIYLKGEDRSLIPIEEKENNIFWRVILDPTDKDSLSQAVAVSPLGRLERKEHITYRVDESKRHFIELFNNSCRFKQPNKLD
ncbi:hypothetical protein GGI35DRAFT_484424 [Trichoderma velutinum]